LGNNYAIVTDSKAEKLFGKRLLAGMQKAGLSCFLVSFKAGEQSKNLKTVEDLSEECLGNGLDRKSAIIALGGGVAGDLAGFVAATFMRGIAFVQVPTTLLAMADSSIGGKVGVDLESGKNIVGAFWQPKKVFIDPVLLKELPPRELRNGLAETVKHAVIADAAFFDFLDNNAAAILKKEPRALLHIAEKNCSIKAAVVEKDEREENMRRILNYGHTVAHALEALTKFKRYSHGEAVAIGLNVEARIAERLGFLDLIDVQRQKSLLEKFGLQTKMPRFAPEKILAQMQKDKKSVGGSLVFALPERIGVMKQLDGGYGVEATEETIKAALLEAMK
jgi:3-dehydroquinate synthase